VAISCLLAMAVRDLIMERDSELTRLALVGKKPASMGPRLIRAPIIKAVAEYQLRRTTPASQSSRQSSSGWRNASSVDSSERLSGQRRRGWESTGPAQMLDLLRVGVSDRPGHSALKDQTSSANARDSMSVTLTPGTAAAP
jgi:hypothetical protein